MSYKPTFILSWILIHLSLCAITSLAFEPIRYELEPGMVLHYQVLLKIETPNTNDTLMGVSKYTVTESDEEGITLDFLGGLQSVSVDKNDPKKHIPFSRWSLELDQGDVKATVRIAKNGALIFSSENSFLPLGLGNLCTLPFEPFPEDDRQSWSTSEGKVILSSAAGDTVGKERCDYRVTQDGDKVSIDRKYSLTTPRVNKTRYIRTEDEGLIQFNRELGTLEILDSEQRVVADLENVSVTFPIELSVYRMKQEEIAAYEKRVAAAEKERELEITKYERPIDPEGKKKSMATLRSDDWQATRRLLIDMRRSVRKELAAVDVDVAVQIGLLRAHQQPEVRSAAEIIWRKWGAAVEKHGTDQQKADVLAAFQTAQKLNEEMAANSAKSPATNPPPAKAPPKNSRTWKNRAGRVVAVGEFVRLDRRRVVLRNTEGKEVKLPLAMLSEKDQAWIEQQ